MSGLPPACNFSRDWNLTHVWQDQLVGIASDAYENVNVKESYHDTSVEVTGEVGMKVTTHAEVEAGIVFAKAKASLGVEIHTSLSVSRTYRIYNRVPPKTVDDVTFGIFRKVASGEWTTIFEDCARFERT